MTVQRDIKTVFGTKLKTRKTKTSRKVFLKIYTMSVK